MRNESKGFKFSEIVSEEERAICYAVANNMQLDKKSVNAQLVEARKLKY